MNIISIEEELEKKRHRNWWNKVSNIIRVMDVFRSEASSIISMVKAHGDKDELEPRCVYSGIDEFFCEEPVYVETDHLLSSTDIEGISPGRYVMVLDVAIEDMFGVTTKRATLTYTKKKVGQPL